MSLDENIDRKYLVDDPLPDPEPAVPSLVEPDPGVFHHEPASLPDEKEPTA